MKKSYIIPTMEVVTIHFNAHMLAGSPGLQGDNINPEVIESRGFFDFGDDDEDEE